MLQHKGGELGEDLEERERRAHYEPVVWLAAGAGARLIGTAVRTPFDVVKERLQIQGSLKVFFLSFCMHFFLSSNSHPLSPFPPSPHPPPQNPPYKSTLHAIRQVILHEGYRGLFNGYICTMTRDVPFAALYFTSYETFKYMFKYKVSDLKKKNIVGEIAFFCVGILFCT